MNPCGLIECNRFTAHEYCWEHAHLTTTAKSATVKKKSTTAYDALPEQVRGIGVVTTRRIMHTRIKSVRRNNPVSYYNMFSIDMMKDMDRPQRARTIRTSEPTTIQENTSLTYFDKCATLGTVGNNPDA